MYPPLLERVVMSESKLKAYLAENPRMVGALFTILLLLSQATTAIAGYSTGTAGP